MAKRLYNVLLKCNDEEEVKSEFQAIKNHGLMLGKGFFLRYKALQHDDKTNTTKEITQR